MTESQESYPPLSDYAVISSCHCMALISQTGAVDWCCMSRVDEDSNYRRLLIYPTQGAMKLGNFPQGLTHVSQIIARLAPGDGKLEDR